MTPYNRTSNLESEAWLRPFRFSGLSVELEEPTPSLLVPDEVPCDVLLALDFDGLSEEPLAMRLARARRRIGDHGVLLLGLPNRFGLRFWSGCPEPGSGRIFVTLIGHEASAARRGAADGPAAAKAVDAPRHFVSRHELAAGFAAAGLAPLEWFFGVPGESGTMGLKSLISEQLVAAAPGVAAEISSARPSADRHRPRLELFPETLVSRELAQAGLFVEFANYFLVATAAAPLSTAEALWTRLRPPAKEIGWHYAAERKVAIETVFEVGANAAAGSGEITVSKRRLNGSLKHHPGDLIPTLPEPATLSPGVPVRLHLEERLVAGGGEAFLDELAAFCAYVQSRFGRGPGLASEALDAILTNASLAEDGTFHLFDLEWRSPEDVPASWWLLRNVLACLDMRGSPIAGIPHGGALYEALCRRLNVRPDLATDLSREVALSRAVCLSASDIHERTLVAALARPWPVPVALALDTAMLSQGLGLAAAHDSLVREYRKLENWTKDLQQALSAAANQNRELENRANDLEARLQRQTLAARP